MNVEGIILACFLSTLFGANNLGVCLAGLSGIGVRGLKFTLLIVGLGLTLGFAAEGWKTKEFIGGFEGGGGLTPTLTLTSTMLIFTLLRLPVSLASALTGAWLGASYPTDPSSITHLPYLLAAWAIAPLLSSLAAAGIYTTLTRLSARMSLVGASALGRLLTLASAAHASYTLGANNLGLISGVTAITYEAIPAVSATTLLGLLFTTRVVRAVGEELVVIGPLGVASSLLSGSLTLWLLTQVGYPASLINSILGGVIGVSFVAKPRLLNRRRLAELFSAWLLAVVLSFTLALIISEANLLG